MGLRKLQIRELKLKMILYILVLVLKINVGLGLERLKKLYDIIYILFNN